MTKRLPLRLGLTEAKKMAEIAEWWRANRPGAPQLFLDELRQAYELVRHQPHVGQSVVGAKSNRIRRVHLLRSRYHLYYQESEDGAAIDVLAVWHTSRGGEPDL